VSLKKIVGGSRKVRFLHFAFGLRCKMLQSKDLWRLIGCMIVISMLFLITKLLKN